MAMTCMFVFVGECEAGWERVCVCMHVCIHACVLTFQSHITSNSDATVKTIGTSHMLQTVTNHHVPCEGSTHTS